MENATTEGNENRITFDFNKVKEQKIMERLEAATI